MQRVIQRNSMLMVPLSLRAISTYRAQILTDSIFIQDVSPTKLPVPVGPRNFEFTLRDSMTIDDFQKQVIDNAEGVSSFKLAGREGSETIGQLKQGQFDMTVNGKRFTIYPDFGSLMPHA